MSKSRAGSQYRPEPKITREAVAPKRDEFAEAVLSAVEALFLGDRTQRVSWLDQYAGGAFAENPRKAALDGLRQYMDRFQGEKHRTWKTRDQPAFLTAYDSGAYDGI